MLVCGCGGWMHTEGVDERLSQEGSLPGLSGRSVVRVAGWLVSTSPQDKPTGSSIEYCGPMMRSIADRVPPYAVPLLRELVEGLPRPGSRG